MNPFDASILHFLNGFAHQWWALDDFVVWVTRDSFQKGGVIALLLWWAWFTADERLETGREKIVCTALAAPCALVFSRIFSEILPFRTRPMHVPELHLQLAYTLSPKTLVNWSSFPSDHAALFFTYVMGLLLISRRLGWIAAVHTLLFISLPRIYLGIHYPTDTIAGAVLGVAVGYLACRPAVRESVARPIVNWAKLHPASFYACFFFYTCQLAYSFGWIRDVLVLVRDVVRS